MAGIPAHHVERARRRFEGEPLPPARLAAKRNLQAEATDSPKTAEVRLSRCQPMPTPARIRRTAPAGRPSREALRSSRPRAERREPSRNLFGLFEVLAVVVGQPKDATRRLPSKAPNWNGARGS